MPLVCEGRCDNFGDVKPSGDFVRFVYVTDDARHGIVLTEDEALRLIASIATAVNRVANAQLSEAYAQQSDALRN